MSDRLFGRRPDHIDTARSGLRDLLLRVVTAEHGTSSVIERPVDSRYRSTAPAPVDPRHGIAAARLIRDSATDLLRRQAVFARAHGFSWAEVGAALGIEADEDGSLAEATFEVITGEPERRFDQRIVSWTCTSCGRTVADYGPYNHPGDNEKGHDEDCVRFAIEWQAHLDRINN